ncbi:BMA-INFT-2, isoform a [Dirofilaria immitis]|nr:BMA-INFT-2, isoform a [Dirofilaria immitis]
MIPLLIQQCQHLRRSVSLNLRKLFGGLIVGSLVQSSFWQALESKADEIKSLAPLKDTEEYYYSAQASPKHEEDSFVTSMTNLSLSFPSNSSDSYVTAVCETVDASSDEIFKIMSPAVSYSEVADKEKLISSRRQGSFDSGKKYEVSGAVPSTSLSHTPQKSSLELLNKETRSLRIILNELQSKTVSDDVKAKIWLL